jgi:hydrogenase maturation protein HypF
VPAPLRLPIAAPEPILALGGEQKSVCAFADGHAAVLTPHLGDLADVRGWRGFLAALDHFRRLLGVAPVVIAHDLHPHYRTTIHARALGTARVAVQHHHAHVASCLAEHGLAGAVIGVAWDGTGHGTDGGVWGGEFLVADLRRFVRAAHLEAVPLPGGEAAIREPWRMAAAFLRAAYGDAADRLDLAFVRGLDRGAWRLLARAAERGVNAPRTSSAGRLFDAVAALLGLGTRVSFEGEAAMALEALAAGEAERTYPVRLDGDVVRSTDVVRGVVADLRGGVPAAAIAARVHATLAHVVARVAGVLRVRTGLGRVALTGGVFQNARLLAAAAARLEADGFEVLCHRAVPPNDGGLALGQAAVAAARLAAGGAG